MSVKNIIKSIYKWIEKNCNIVRLTLSGYVVMAIWVIVCGYLNGIIFGWFIDGLNTWIFVLCNVTVWINTLSKAAIKPQPWNMAKQGMFEEIMIRTIPIVLLLEVKSGMVLTYLIIFMEIYMTLAGGLGVVLSVKKNERKSFILACGITHFMICVMHIIALYLTIEYRLLGAAFAISIHGVINYYAIWMYYSLEKFFNSKGFEGNFYQRVIDKYREVGYLITNSVQLGLE